MQTNQENQDYIEANQYPSYKDILRIKNIEFFKILSVLINEDSIPSDKIFNFFKKYTIIINDPNQDTLIKFNAIAQIVNENNLYIDSAFEIWLNSIYIVLINNQIDLEKRLPYLVKFDKFFEFLKSKKNTVGRVYMKEERVIKTISRVMQIISQNDCDDKDDLAIKSSIYDNIQKFLNYHLSRANFLGKNILKFSEKDNSFELCYEFIQSNKDPIINYVGANLYENISIIRNKLNCDGFIFKNRADFILILIIILPYEIGVGAVLGYLDYATNYQEIIDNSSKLTEIKNYYRELFLKELQNIPQISESLTNLRKKTNIFFDQSKQEIDLVMDQLISCANFFKNSSSSK
ncbi:hypothetical protein LBMAG18_01540 [Alphaproteobacteria bacterium]|nr:hypothetical protein LBMAG18_01540 [Alphaproteobacteria bacterium]